MGPRRVPASGQRGARALTRYRGQATWVQEEVCRCHVLEPAGHMTNESLKDRFCTFVHYLFERISS